MVYKHHSRTIERSYSVHFIEEDYPPTIRVLCGLTYAGKRIEIFDIRVKILALRRSRHELGICVFSDIEVLVNRSAVEFDFQRFGLCIVAHGHYV